MSRNLGMVFPGNSLGVGSGREAVKQWRPSRSAPGVARGRMNRMGCGACWDETCREKGDVVRGGWADVARRLPASSSIWVAHCGAGRTLSFGDKVFSLSVSDSLPSLPNRAINIFLLPLPISFV